MFNNSLRDCSLASQFLLDWTLSFLRVHLSPSFGLHQILLPLRLSSSSFNWSALSISNISALVGCRAEDEIRERMLSLLKPLKVLVRR
jgi:hypothetical protein